MYLYNLTLQKATAISHAVHGSFSSPDQQEILVSHGKSLELLRPDPNTGKIHSILTFEIFGVVRSLIAYRLLGGNKDYVVVGSDSGQMVILEYSVFKNNFEKVHEEKIGKTGCRRTVPGQYLAADPKGRAIMIGAVEKQKKIYLLNRESDTRLKISLPLEAYESNTLIYHMVGIDVHENPLFACLEIDYEEAHAENTDVNRMKQKLNFYGQDFNSKNIVRKYSETLNQHANLLISVPGGTEGPSGVLICSENYIIYKSLGQQYDIRCPIPRRRNDLDDPERGMILVCSATHRTRSSFFFLVQSEQGDIFRVTLKMQSDFTVTEIKLKYFDTVPVATSLCILQNGFLFVASEFGNHHLYQFAHLGDDEEPEFSSSACLDEGETFFFSPRPLRNLILVDEMNSFSPILDCKVANLAENETPQLYMACGRGPRSTLRVLRYGLGVSEMAVSELPGTPNAVWTIKKRSDDVYDSYIVISFVNTTLVLSIGETVEEVDLGFLSESSSIACSSFGDDAAVQVYPGGVRHIRSNKRVQWKAPGEKRIVKCALNQSQIVIALTSFEIVYFVMDPGQIKEYFKWKQMPAEVVCMALGKAPAGEQMSRFVAVGSADNTVRIISLVLDNCFSILSMQSVPNTTSLESLCIVEMGVGKGPKATTYLYIGLSNGVLLQSALDPISGDLIDTRSRNLGTRPVKLFAITMHGQQAVVAMSSRSWLSYSHQNRFHLTPLLYDSFEYASSFATEQCPEGIVAIVGNTLRILPLEKQGAIFNQISTPLKYTPRKFLVHPESSSLIIIETDHNTFTDETIKQMRLHMAKEMEEAAEENEIGMAKQFAIDFLSEELPEKIFGAPKAGIGHWASLVRILNPITGSTIFVSHLEQNEAAISLGLVRFLNLPETLHLVVGVAKDYQLNTKKFSSCYLHTYKFKNHKLELVHRTALDELPNAICPFYGRLLVGVGRYLRIYEYGEKKLIKKCENEQIPNMIVKIEAMGRRIYVSDIQESVFMVRYKAAENQLIVFADDIHPRWITATSIIDYNTIACADKFGNFSVVRLPSNASDDLDDDSNSKKPLSDRAAVDGVSQKLSFISNFHVGEIITSLQYASLITGGPESLIYTTLSGSVGILIPFNSHEDQDFFHQLETNMRSEYPPLCGRGHLSYRSYYFPVENVIDGDLCEQFNSLEPAKQSVIAMNLGTEPNEITKKLEDIRTKYASQDTSRSPLCSALTTINFEVL